MRPSRFRRQGKCRGARCQRGWCHTSSALPDCSQLVRPGSLQCLTPDPATGELLCRHRRLRYEPSGALRARLSGKLANPRIQHRKKFLTLKTSGLRSCLWWERQTVVKKLFTRRQKCCLVSRELSISTTDE